MGYSGSDWVKESLKKDLSPLGRVVADILGDAFLGIYHLDLRQLKKVDWSNTYWIEVNHFGALATVDFNLLTRLVVLCHARMVRMAIQPVNFHYLKLMFHQRDSRTGGISVRCPDMIDHVLQIEKHYGIERDSLPPPRAQRSTVPSADPDAGGEQLSGRI